MVEARREREKLREGIQELGVGMTQLQDVAQRLTNVQERIEYFSANQSK